MTLNIIIYSSYAKCWQEGVGRRQEAGGSWQEQVNNETIKKQK